ncbi:XPA-binding protein [Myriangium duriaei CBS 260.36]|uniref:GPN-loop GTPase n=1 Tax=Myriangium duriaei CBS 260.36 TaxID=1168546 RepID=A0A9P4J963_9PEZI|nr:XPA-binding protein [Myriangium duriaei CBS 260.36]
MATAPSAASPGQKPISVVCVGMAGSGKTTFMQRINSYLHQKREPPYVLNLDPAVRSTPYESNIDIRDSVNYKEVMKQYNLGPNGGIITSLNLFATKIDQVLGLLEKRCLPDASAATPTKPPHKHILLDTPGQIEVFVWSASGSILLSALASSFPTVLAYIIDTPRTTSSTSTFMSNMLYAISIMYKTKLPMILVFNKTDVKDPSESIEWMRDFESFQAALRREEETETEGGAGGTGYMSSLLNSMSLVLEEFYNNLSVVGVSSMTGDGVDDFFAAVESKRAEFDAEYAPELQRRRAEREAEKEGNREKEVERLMKDMGVSEKKAKGKPREEPETVSEAEEMSDDDDVGDDSEDEANTGRGGAESGLKQRYQQALQDSSSMSAEDASFAKYLAAARANQS